MKKSIRTILITFLFSIACFASDFTAVSDTLPFTCGELLGRPTANSITIHACTNRDLDVYFEYGTDSLNFTNSTNVKRCLDSIPFVEVLGNLSPNTQYYYRMRYREIGMTNFFARGTHTFHTARPAGSTFTFAVEADPHLDTNSIPAVYTLTLQNILSKKPDFLLDLGDTFMSEKLASQTQLEITKRHLLLREYFDHACHSIPLFLTIGNHEGELGWRLDGTATSLPVLASNTRKLYYPNPEPDAFYSGNSTPEQFVGLRQNYYAWEWGDALFIVIDPYWYTKTKPGWGWTLGATQYNWFKSVVTTSQAKFKFVFCHQIVGGNGNDGRGGTEYAGLFEMGGLNLDSTWGFFTNRPGWEKPIHSLMVENNVSIFFHGHDHFYGRQEKDGVIYQEVPQPSSKSFTNISATQYGYVNGVFLPSRGYLLLTVNDTSAKVEYIRTYLPSEENSQRHNGDIGHSYTIIKSPTGIKQEPQTIPDEYKLHQNYPNPFAAGSPSGNSETVIRYELPVEGYVSLKVYDMLGVEVSTLVDEVQKGGSHEYKFSAKNLSSGIYFYRLSSGAFSATKRMLLLK
ncbi:MAG: metallophosphoesterase [Ignavibacteria bacterium]|nr:metallophosphoesterase [Ignavibacteria bacterium]